MFAVAELINLTVMLFSPIVLWPVEDYGMVKSFGYFSRAEFKREWWRADADCRFDAVITPFEQDWEEIIKEGESGQERRIPPQLGVVKGYAIVIHTKTCPNSAPEPILRVATRHKTGSTLHRRDWYSSEDFTEMKEDADRPKWWPQVARRLQDEGTDSGSAVLASAKVLGQKISVASAKQDVHEVQEILEVPVLVEEEQGKVSPN